jgi:ElaB/YqjD/DUF883 family membrane-anchored ribosome-binding protein
MIHTAGKFNQAKSKMADDFRMIVNDGEEMLRAAADASGEGFTAARATFADRVMRARAGLAEMSEPVVERARQANDYVHDSPWMIIGMAAAAGMLVGFLAARR